MSVYFPGFTEVILPSPEKKRRFQRKARKFQFAFQR